jgi:hypothetical protein
MPRIKELVRIATLERHFQHGLVATVEIVDLGGHWSVCVRYNERAEEPRKRFLTSQRLPGPKRFASLSTAWKVLSAHGILNATVRKATPAEVNALYTRRP